ncbi:MAG: RpiB/LacA/LacB family sugar-phosphate isomerase [Erysipelotrichaceae bacterium]
MKIAIACDPNAESAKLELIDFINANHLAEVHDLGSDDEIYANTAIELATRVAAKEFDKGILLCGTGIGVSITANKVKGAYAALAYDVYSAQRCVLSNNANIVCMGAFTVGSQTRKSMVKEFLTNEFDVTCASKPKVDAFVAYDTRR